MQRSGCSKTASSLYFCRTASVLASGGSCRFPSKCHDQGDCSAGFNNVNEPHVTQQHSSTFRFLCNMLLLLASRLPLKRHSQEAPPRKDSVLYPRVQSCASSSTAWLNSQWQTRSLISLRKCCPPFSPGARSTNADMLTKDAVSHGYGLQVAL